MQEIIVSEPIASSHALERLHLFPGRHLGEQEFEQMQAYADRRIQALLQGRDPGIVEGLNVRARNIAHLGEGFTVSPGLALSGKGELLGLFSPLRQTWQGLLDNFLSEIDSEDATGVYYLTLKRATHYIDADPSVDACQRNEFDPLRDARRVQVGTLSLRRLALNNAAVENSSQDLIENWVAANNVGGEFLTSMNNAVPLGLLAIANNGSETEADFQLQWFSEAAGRYMAAPHSGYAVLRKQVESAFQRSVKHAALSLAPGESEADYIAANLQLNFLPATGQLPLSLIRNIASQQPRVAWLPSHIYVDMIAVSESVVGEVLERHTARRATDLRQPSNTRLRLLLAVNEADYSPQLMQFPQTDARLQDDIYRYYQRAYRAWGRWMESFYRLYHLRDQDALDPQTLKSLDLPRPIAPPPLPQSFYAALIEKATRELAPGNANTLPYPYNNGVPPEPDFYRAWATADPSNTGQASTPPAIPEPETHGWVIQHTLATHELEALDNEIRAVRARLEKTRDYLLLQRQQLDNQTVSMAALAGGVAGDGSGLQVARWLPFTKMKAPPEDEPTENETESDETSRQPAAFSYLEKRVPDTFMLSAKKAPLAELIQRTPQKQQLFSSTLRKLPSVLSNVQLSLNRSILDKIAAAPKAAVTRPAFETKEFRFGVLEHIRPEIQEYKKIHGGMSDLMSTLGKLFDKAEACSIRKTLNSFGTPTPLSVLGIEGDDIEKGDRLTAQIYEAMFRAGKILTQQIAHMEGRYARIESLLEGKLRSRIYKEAEIEKLTALIVRATEELDNLDKPRIEILGDYGVAQRLLDEDWETVYKQNLERTRILTSGVKGLYFVRERQAPISMPLADPLELRFGSANDIVPGCDWEDDPELPEELEEFYDTVMEVPMADWVSLKDLSKYVPTKSRLHYIANLRQTRMQAKHSRSQSRRYRRSNVNISLAQVHQQSIAMLSHWSRFAMPISIASVRQRQVEAAKVMSLEDILSGTRGRLKNEAQTLSTRLAQAVHCMLEKLNEIAPSLRLQWAQLAEDDRIRVDKTELWPGLERAEREDFNATRTLAELVHWWFSQIDKGASANGKEAMRNMIRATLIHAALGDPSEILRGQVQVPPRRMALGETMRLRLNRPARTGSILQLLDTKQTLVAMLKVEDDDESGVVAQVTRVAVSSTRVTTEYTVVANQLTRLLS